MIPIQNLREAAEFLEGQIRLAATRIDVNALFNQPLEDDLEFAEVKGQESVKRALEIAASGSHNLLLL